MVSWHEEEDNHLIEDKRNGKATFVRTTNYCCGIKWCTVCALLHLALSLAKVVRQAVVLKILYTAACKCFLVFNGMTNP